MEQLAAQHRFKYEVVTADIDEKAIRHDEPKQLVRDLAFAKAAAIQEKLAQTQPDWLRDGLLITCDQVGGLAGRCRVIYDRTIPALLLA